MELLLPANLGTRDLPRLYEICGQVLGSSDSEIILDAKNVSFIEPHGLTVLAALLSRLDGRRIAMRWLKTDLAGYMDRMDFFAHCDVQEVQIPDWKRHARPEKLVELTCITSYTDAERAADRLADAITGQLTSADPAAPFDPATGKNEYERYRHPIWYSLSEMMGNALTHAKRHGRLDARVWVAAQFYQKSNEIKLSVVDDGCGILRTLTGHPKLRNATHLNAIRVALEPKVSCNRESPYRDGHGNQGVGLTTTMRIAHAAKGRLLIASGTAQLNSESMRGYDLPAGGRWDGVAIAFSCRRHALPAVNLRALLPVEKGEPPLVHFVDE